MAEYTKQEIFDIITEYLQIYGSAIGSDAVHELTPEELTDENLRVLTIPGMRPDTEEWVQTSMANMIKPITHAVSDLSTLKQQTIAAKDAAETAATGASNVNATLVNMTVTITDRTGLSRSVDIGFEMYKTYPSVAAMNAEASIVPQGKFVIIATEDPTSADNAKLYCKNSQGSFTFLTDLDQASAAAWADWLESMKPQIEAAINQAASDHRQFLTDHQTATSDHQTALTDHSNALNAAASANTQAARAKGYNDHPWEIRDDGFIYVWNETTQQMTKTNKMIIGFNDLTEAQKQSMIDIFYATLTYASVETCEDIIDELT